MTSVSAAEIAHLVQALSTDERLALIDQLWAGLSDEQLPLTAAQQAELRRRIDSFDVDQHDAQAWETVRAELSRDVR